MHFSERGSKLRAPIAPTASFDATYMRMDHILCCTHLSINWKFRLQQGETSRDIATRKDLNEILQILNSPAAAQPSGSPEKIIRSSTKKTREKGKKRKKIESDTSSKDSGSRPKDRKKVFGQNFLNFLRERLLWRH
jgi:hypothetical protein